MTVLAIEKYYDGIDFLIREVVCDVGVAVVTPGGPVDVFAGSLVDVAFCGLKGPEKGLLK